MISPLGQIPSRRFLERVKEIIEGRVVVLMALEMQTYTGEEFVEPDISG